MLCLVYVDTTRGVGVFVLAAAVLMCHVATVCPLTAVAFCVHRPVKVM
jgi:hypothetical protein